MKLGLFSRIEFHREARMRKERPFFMKNILRVAAAVFKTALAQPMKNAESILAILESCNENKPDFIVFPELCLSGASCQEYMRDHAILSGCLAALNKLVTASVNFNIFIVVGLPISISGHIYSCSALIKAGKLVALVPSLHPTGVLSGAGIPCELMIGTNRVPFGTDLMFRFGNTCFAIETGVDPQELPYHLARFSAQGAELVLCPMSLTARFGQQARLPGELAMRSRQAACGIVYSNSGFGESTSAAVYKGFTGIFECGHTMEFQWQERPYSQLCMQDLDLDIIRSRQGERELAPGAELHVVQVTFSPTPKSDLLRKLKPSDRWNEQELHEAFSLQKAGLFGRLSNTGIGKLAVGVSGDVDSALALLAACGTLDMLGLPRENLIAVVLPGFDTADAAYYNALKLISVLGVSLREISVKDSVLQHLANIGRDTSNLSYDDDQFLDAQTRERSIVLFDLADQEGALVVGTSDLSEIALGRCTFGGDHMSSYNPNACLTKTLVRKLLAHVADRSEDESLSEVLHAILDTPTARPLEGVEEEPRANPYELHDFFLYYFLRYHFSASKLLSYASKAFQQVYDETAIRKYLKLFLSRFVQSQFKRGGAGESAALSEIALNNFARQLPSDAPADILLGELEKGTFFQGSKV